MLKAIRDFGRPLAALAMLMLLLTGSVAAGVMECLAPGLGIRFTAGVAGWFRAIPVDYYNLTAIVLSVWGVSRGVEKIASGMKAAPPAAPDGEPDQ